MLDLQDAFSFHNDTDYNLVLLFDFNTDDNVITPDNCYRSAASRKSTVRVSMDASHSWDKYVTDSLHLYLVDSDPISRELENDWSLFSVDMIKDEYLVARMTLILDDIYPTTWPWKEISFPPSNLDWYNTIFYNGCYNKE